MVNLSLIYERNKFHIISVLLIIILTSLVYANSLKGAFLWDDRFLVEENPLIKDFSNIGKIFSSPLTPDFYQCYRPLANVSLMVDYHFWKLNPFGYHLSNIIIHIFNACLVYFLISLIAQNKSIALASGLIFGVHTILTEPVNYISSRADLLLGFFFIASIIFYILHKNRSTKQPLYYFCSALCFISSILSKELALILPFTLMLYELFFKPKEIKLSKSAITTLPFFVIVLIYAMLRMTVLKFSAPSIYIPEGTIASFSFAKRFFTSIKVFPLNFRLMILPFGLHKAWYIKPISSIELPLILSLIFMAALLILSKTIYTYSKLSAFGFGWCFILLLPHMNIYPLNAFVNEGWLYLPTVGMILFFSSLFVRFIAWKNQRNRIILTVILVCFLTYYSVSTFNRNKTWASDPAFFYKETLKYNPGEDRIHNVLGNVYVDEGKLDLALTEYNTSRNINPNNPATYYNIGNVYAKQGKLDEAMAQYKQALELSPNYDEAHNNLGFVYFRQDNLIAASDAFKKAIKLSPNNSRAYYNLGNVYLRSNDIDFAILEYRKSLSVDPGFASSYHMLGKAYFQLKNYPQAEAEYKKSLELNPDSAVFHNDLGNVYVRQSKLDLAISEFKKSIELDPVYVQAYNDLGSCYFQLKRFNEAIIHYNKAISLNPNYADVYYNLGVIYYLLDNHDESRKNLQRAIDLFNQQNNQASKKEAESLLLQM